MHKLDPCERDGHGSEALESSHQAGHSLDRPVFSGVQFMNVGNLQLVTRDNLDWANATNPVSQIGHYTEVDVRTGRAADSRPVL